MNSKSMPYFHQYFQQYFFFVKTVNCNTHVRRPTLSDQVSITVNYYSVCLCMDSHWPSPTYITKVSPFCICTQKQHHLKMFTGQTGAKRRRLVHRGRTDVLLRHWLVVQVNLASSVEGSEKYDFTSPHLA